MVLVYFGSTESYEYSKIYSLVAKRYDKAFFLRAKDGSDLASIFEIEADPDVLIFTQYSTEHLHFDKDWTHANFERWIV